MTINVVPINKDIYDRPITGLGVGKTKKIGMKFFLPPTDKPESVNTYLDIKTDTFVIHFIYSLFEKEKCLFSNKYADIYIGEGSGKPISIRIKGISENKIDKIQLVAFIKGELSSYINRNTSQVSELRQKTNIERIKEFLNEQASQIAVLPK